jgi:hypothetical protein
LVQAQQMCPPGYPRTTPDSDFADVGNGTVQHIPTGLIWKRCAEGQDWNGSTCIGSAAVFTWEQAFARAAAVNTGGAGTWNAGQTDWRVPNQKELTSIAERGCSNPSINMIQFPAMPMSGVTFYWSSSPAALFPDSARALAFSWGQGTWISRSTSSYVRLVRAGQSFYNFDAAVTYALTVVKTGAGSGTVTSSPAGIDCGATCTASFYGGLTVTLTAAAATGSTFAGWSGAGCSGTGTCVVTMDEAKSSTASFTQNTYAVTATAGTGGTASCTPNPAAHGGTSTCTATANAGYTFAAWAGDCAGQTTASCTLTNITAARSSAASFTAVATAPAITSGTPPGGTVGTPYSFTATATGTAPIAFAATGLPPGLALNASSGAITGTPTSAGSFDATITATNGGGVATENYRIVIAGGSASAQSIPTLSEWGMIILSLLIAGMTALRFRRG